MPYLPPKGAGLIFQFLQIREQGLSVFDVQRHITLAQLDKILILQVLRLGRVPVRRLLRQQDADINMQDFGDIPQYFNARFRISGLIFGISGTVDVELLRHLLLRQPRQLAVKCQIAPERRIHRPYFSLWQALTSRQTAYAILFRIVIL